MANIPSFLSGQQMENDYDLNRSSNRNNGNGKKNRGDNNDWFAFQSTVSDLSDKKNELIKQTADAVAKYAMNLNQKGVTSVSNISKNIMNGLNDFSDNEKNQILSYAIGKIIANI